MSTKMSLLTSSGLGEWAREGNGRKAGQPHHLHAKGRQTRAGHPSKVSTSSPGEGGAKPGPDRTADGPTSGPSSITGCRTSAAGAS